MRSGSVPLPPELTEDVLPRVTDLAELKAVLYVLHLAAVGDRPGVALSELIAGGRLQAIVGLLSPDPAEVRLARVLERAVANGFLYRVTIRGEDWLFPPTRDGRAALDSLRGGDGGVLRDLGLPPDAEATIHRSNLYSLYERFIGPLTPLLAEQIRDAERLYPRSWIEEAISLSAENNHRSWRYVEGILLRWEGEGRTREADAGAR